MHDKNSQTDTLQKDIDVNVFITHKADHLDEAEQIIDALQPYASERLKFKLSEKMPPGVRWEDWIRENVASSQVLFFIVPKPDIDWSWPIYEAGLFEGSPNLEQDSKRIILLHGKNLKTPSPLDRLQTVEATEKSVIDFLKKFFGTTEITGVEPALNKSFANNKDLLTQTAKTICKLFVTGSDPIASSFYCTPHIAIKVGNSRAIREDVVPSDAIVEYEKGTLSIFGLGGQLALGKTRLTWSDFQTQITSSHKRWLEQLVNAIDVTNQGHVTPSLNTTFRDHNNKIYSPALYRVDDEKDGSRKFHVVFIKQASEGMFINVPDIFATLLTSLTLGSRLEWEVCREFLGKLERWKFDKAEKEKGCEQIRTAIANIENEAEYRKQELSERVKTDRLLLAFESQNVISEIKLNLEEQQELKQFLSQAGRETELNKIREALDGLLHRNQAVMLKVSDRYNELLQRQ